MPFQVSTAPPAPPPISPAARRTSLACAPCPCSGFAPRSARQVPGVAVAAGPGEEAGQRGAAGEATAAVAEQVVYAPPVPPAAADDAARVGGGPLPGP